MKEEKKISSTPLNKLEELGKQLVENIEKEESPTFRTKLRSQGNIIYEPGLGYLILGEKTEERRFLNLAQAKRFMQTIAIANKCKKFLLENAHTSIRGLFYQLKYSLGENLEEELFSEQEESNPLIEDIEVALGVKREDLNLTTDRKGVLAGPIKIIDRFGGEEINIDGTKLGRSGWAIPSDVDNNISFEEIKARYVLIVEKDAMWQRLNEERYWEKEKCILITPKGQASRGCRRLIRKLVDLGLPCYVFTDCDAWGWYIYWTIKTGSMNLAYLGRHIAVPEAKFIGVTMQDIKDYPFLEKLTIKAKEIDLKRAQELLDYEWINKHPEWVNELKAVLNQKKKLEQDALQGPRLSFVVDYLKEKIGKNKFLP